jgi:prepilin-type N-terminal cleavage/methylation domain-containing protein
MSIQKKKGFTLIELMVVIVIIGILAAIAIPKLFGMTAKAKASEVGPAAGTWSKLQQAHAMDTDSLGSFVKIGYTPPGAVVSDAAAGKQSETGQFRYSGTPTDNSNASSASWKAEVIGKDLGDCPASSAWSATMALAENGKPDEIQKPTTTITGQGGKDDDCRALTPNFDKLQ